MKEQNCAILGSGFGLYGYLPAFAKKGYRVFLPNRYAKTFSGRPELLQFCDQIEFVLDEQEAIRRSTACVIAKRPQDQPYWVNALLQSGTCEKVILEKPIAITPTLAMTVLHACRNENLNVRVGYTFLHTKWGRKVLQVLAGEEGQSVSIRWEFMAHHFVHHLQNWKRFDRQGGGALRFYGIQILPLLAAAEGWDLMQSTRYHENEGETICWTFDGVTKKGCQVHVKVDSASLQTSFYCHIRGKASLQDYAYRGKSPFLPSSTDQDNRVMMLMEIIDSLSCQNDPFPFYEKIIRLWNEIEKNCNSMAIDNTHIMDS